MMIKAGRVFKYFVAAGLISALSILSACGSSNLSNSNNSTSTAGTNSNANSGAVETRNAGASETKNKDTSPVTTTISDLFAETKSGSVMEKYMDREMTVTGGILYELESDSLKVGMGQNPDFGVESTSPQYFVTCKGKPEAYSTATADDVAKWRKEGRATVFNVKGVFKEAGSYNNKHWVILDQCAHVKS